MLTDTEVVERTANELLEFEAGAIATANELLYDCWNGVVFFTGADNGEVDLHGDDLRHRVKIHFSLPRADFRVSAGSDYRVVKAVKFADTLMLTRAGEYEEPVGMRKRMRNRCIDLSRH